MKRSIGVTAIAILSLLGSFFTLLLGVGVAIVPFFAFQNPTNQPPFSPGFLKVMMFGAALVYLVPAVWGIITSIGLFRLKEWARISILVFSVLLILMGGFGGVITAVMPMPPTTSEAATPAVMNGVPIFMASFAAAMVSIGIWWLVFFTRAKVRRQFVPIPARQDGSAPVESVGSAMVSPVMVAAPVVTGRPLSLTILAWFMLLGCLFIPVNIVLRSPAMLFTTVLTGWPATLFFMGFAGVHLYVGIGLLRLKPAARMVGILYYTFTLINLAVFYLAPGFRPRMKELMQRSLAAFPWMHPADLQAQITPLLDQTPLVVIGACFGLAITLAILYILITSNPAFEQASPGTAERHGSSAGINR